MRLIVYCQNTKYALNPQSISDLDVHYGIADNFVNLIPVFYNNLSDYEKARANCFKYESDYISYISAHALLRIELSKLLNTNAKSIRIEQADNEKPFLPGINLTFSLSRNNKSFAFVFGHSNQLIGIDVEQIKTDIDFTGISERYFSVKEQQLIHCFDRTSDQIQAFYEIWTRKEALLKSIGIGINTELSKFQVLEGENQLDIEGLQLNTSSFKILTIMKDRALISIASSIDFNPLFKDLSF